MIKNHHMLYGLTATPKLHLEGPVSYFCIDEPSVSDRDPFHFGQPDPDPFHETDPGNKISAKIMENFFKNQPKS